jgi:hypothetical protein
MFFGQADPSKFFFIDLLTYQLTVSRISEGKKVVRTRIPIEYEMKRT